MQVLIILIVLNYVSFGAGLLAGRLIWKRK